MKKKFSSRKNYEASKQAVGYVPRRDATQDDYDRIGFMSGLEVHQQILTDKKLFCRCPAGQFHNHEDYDAEVIRHMRPTLSELGEYDGTALMEFKTRKEITYHCKHETTCTYDVDDTPPFPINRQALERAIEISLLSKLNIVGEVHITRKQYLDGSIPAGFQRTAIIGVEGEMELKNKKIGLIQLSLEEDSCREISDVGHKRLYNTDRLGMPLIETVTYPEFLNPDEVKEGCDTIRFMNRSTGKVRTGMGAGRQDLNVSCRGGHRVEIKGVAHTKWLPALSHNEAFRQWALLGVKDLLNKTIPDAKSWCTSHQEISYDLFDFPGDALKSAHEQGFKIIAVNLPKFQGILSHFTQPGKVFAGEISGRLKVVACLEQPNMTHSEALSPIISGDDFAKINARFNTSDDDAQIIFWGPADDVKTALETIEERCQMAFDGIPPETRKGFKDGTSIFERVLPGADRMYPDTDSAPIPLEEIYINKLQKNLPSDIIDRYRQLMAWGIPEDTHTYIFKKNLYPLVEKIVTQLDINPCFTGTFIGHTLKYIEGQSTPADVFDYNKIFDLFKYLKDNNLELLLAKIMLPEFYAHPKMDFDSILATIKFKPICKDDIIAQIPFLKEKFQQIKFSDQKGNEIHWVMGQLREAATGNINLTQLEAIVKK